MGTEQNRIYKKAMLVLSMAFLSEAGGQSMAKFLIKHVIRCDVFVPGCLCSFALQEYGTLLCGAVKDRHVDLLALDGILDEFIHEILNQDLIVLFTAFEFAVKNVKAVDCRLYDAPGFEKAALGFFIKKHDLTVWLGDAYLFGFVAVPSVVVNSQIAKHAEAGDYRHYPAGKAIARELAEQIGHATHAQA